ncbi:thioredoxin-like protein [Flammula alnicola]|nr:thioredoxin-like protein [Flammula alnicola]
MFNSFKRKLPEISIFHHPSSPPSTKALNLLRSSLSGPYPPENAKGQPLDFKLDVVESAPTSDQLKTILSYLPSKAVNPSMVFLSAHPSAPSAAEQPTSVKGIAELAESNPNAIKWPIVVDWEDGKASIGDVEGVKGILETIRKRRDGELKEEEVHKPGGWFV